MRQAAEFIYPQWPAPLNVKAFSTTRKGGISIGNYQNLNLANHVDDNPEHVAANRTWIAKQFNFKHEPIWIDQVHGYHVIEAHEHHRNIRADASVSFEPEQICVINTADCLPILMCNKKGTAVAAIHAGWRGLHQRIIAATLKKLNLSPEELLVWLGPCIGPTKFEVGEEVRTAFINLDPHTTDAFIPHANQPGKWFANLHLLAMHQLQHAKIPAENIYRDPSCAYSQPDRFFSYRRDGITGRMSTFIWLST